MTRWIWVLALALPACDLTGPNESEPRGRYELADFLLVNSNDTLTTSDFSQDSYLYLDFVDDRVITGEGFIEVEIAGQVVDWLFGRFDGSGIVPQALRGEYILVGDQIDFDFWAEGRYTWLSSFTWTLSPDRQAFSIEESTSGEQLRIEFRR